MMDLPQKVTIILGLVETREAGKSKTRTIQSYPQATAGKRVVIQDLSQMVINPAPWPQFLVVRKRVDEDPYPDDVHAT